jgi:hypothetical protein
MKYFTQASQTTATFISWQPSTWPDVSNADAQDVIPVLRVIVRETVVDEIANVISDAITVNGDLQHRGHVVALALMCALDAVAAYGYRGGHGPQIVSFVGTHFPPQYRAYGQEIYELYRCALVHEWNLFKVAISPGEEPFRIIDGTLSIGLITLFNALCHGVEAFFTQLATDDRLLGNAGRHYNKLRLSATP